LPIYGNLRTQGVRLSSGGRIKYEDSDNISEDGPNTPLELIEKRRKDFSLFLRNWIRKRRRFLSPLRSWI